MGQTYGPMLDPMVKVYDVRTMRPLAPIGTSVVVAVVYFWCYSLLSFSCRVCRVATSPAFPPGAFLLKFHPKFSSSLFIVSQNGQIQICEAQGDPTSLQMYQVRVNTSAGHSPNNKFNLRWGFTRPTAAETW